MVKGRIHRLVIFAAATVAFAATASTASAAAPVNDLVANATVVSAGFNQSLDTSTATTDADDTQFNATCGAPATDASVWYTIQGTGQGMIVDVSASNYSAGVLVGVGTPGSLTTIACGPGSTAFATTPGTTYYVLAIDDQLNGDGLNGGTLRISFNALAPPVIDLTIDTRGTFDAKTGAATVSGTFRCTNAAGIQITGQAVQTVGRLTLQGSVYAAPGGGCDGTWKPWSAQVTSPTGKYKGGKLQVDVTAFGCGSFECTQASASREVQLGK